LGKRHFFTEISDVIDDVNNISRKCIPYIYYSLAKKWALLVVENVVCTVDTDGHGWRDNE